MPDNTALKAELRVMLATEKRVLRQLSVSYSNISKRLTVLQKTSGAGAAVERAQLRELQSSIKTEMSSMWKNIGNEVRAGRIQAAGAAGELSQEALEYFKGAGLSPSDIEVLRRSSKAAAENTVNTAMKRMQGDSYIPLSERVYHTESLVNGQLDRVINNAILTGVNAAKLAKDVREFIRPDTAGGVRYAANRLARTEINNAFHAAAVQEMQSEPFVDAIEWNLSGSHPKPDECNRYAESVHFKGGDPGVYRKSDVPARPHPNCLCYVTAVDIGPDEFIKQFREGKYDEWLTKNGIDTGVVQAERAKSLSAVGTPPGIPDSEYGREFMTVNGYSDRVVHEMGGQYEKAFTDLEREARAKYAAGDYFFEIRDAWNEGRPYPLSDGSNLFDALASAHEKSKLDNNSKLYRTMKVNQKWIDDNTSPGSTIEHNFYISTASDFNNAKAYGRKKGARGQKDILLEILAPKGTSVIPGMIGEWVLPPGTKMNVRRSIYLESKKTTLITVELY